MRRMAAKPSWRRFRLGTTSYCVGACWKYYIKVVNDMPVVAQMKEVL
jgi:hypothetical protein